MHRLRSLFVLLLVAAPLLAQSHDERIRAFESFAARVMKAQRMPGLSVAVSHGNFRWSRGFGFADVENSVPATALTSYRTASVTKPMTAIAVLKLAEEGVIDLDAEVQRYVRRFPFKKYPVTVRQLLSHQGGISHYRDYATEGRIREPKTTAEAIAIFEQFDLVHEPGTKMTYTSYGYNLLGAVIEGATGRTYESVVREKVWTPLGMTSTLMDDPRAIIPYRADGYVLEDGRLRRSEYVDMSSRFAGGGTRSTAGDMLRLVEGLAEGRVLRDATREEAWTMRATRDGRYTRYGYGFGLYPRNGRAAVAHTGAQQETRTLVFYLPRAKFAIALASNFENADLAPFEEKLIELFVGDPAPVPLRGRTESDTRTLEALQQVFNSGLAYYDRHGRAMTTDARELAEAFRYFRESLSDEQKIADGIHPVAGEPYVTAGSHIAATLARDGRDLALYHREGALRFFADYARVARAHKLDANLAARVRAWSEEWARVYTPELRALQLWDDGALDVLERHRASLVAASVRPDLSGELLSYASRRRDAGDVVEARRAIALGLALDPESKALREAQAIDASR